MTIIDNQMLWRQFNTTIDSFGDALRTCPPDLWETQLWEDEPDQWVAKGFSTSIMFLIYISAQLFHESTLSLSSFLEEDLSSPLS